MSDEKTGLGKNDTLGKMEREEHLEKQPSHDLASSEVNYETDLNDSRDPNKNTDIMPSLLPNKEEPVIPAEGLNLD